MRLIESPWRVLGIERTTDTGLIRKAYAAKLKVTRPDDDRAGFERLRTAYETAMSMARGQVPQEIAPPVEPTPPAPVEQESPVATSPPPLTPEQTEIHELGAAFAELHQILTNRGAESSLAMTALEKILSSPALDNLSVERHAQEQLASLMVRFRPATDALLVRADQRFQWSRADADRLRTPILAVVAQRLSDLDFLELLKTNRSPYSNAFRKLQKPKLPFLSRLAVSFQKTGTTGEYQLLQMIRLRHPALLSELNPDAVNWWNDLASRPRVSPTLLIVGLIFGALSGIAASEGDGSSPSGGWVFAITFGFFLALALWRLWLLDWPRHLIEERELVLPLHRRVGWLPAMAAVLVLAAIVPVLPGLNIFMVLLALAAMQWALIVSPPWPPSNSTDMLRYPLVRVFFHNFPIGVWLFAVLMEIENTTQLTTAICCALIISVGGLPGTVASWEQELSSRQRWYWLVATAIVSVLAGVCLWNTDSGEIWCRLAVALVVAALIMHRPPVAMFTNLQQRLRLFATCACIIVLIAIVAQPDPVFGDQVMALSGFGLLFIVTILFCVAMAMWNEWRGRPAPYRQEPAQKALGW